MFPRFISRSWVQSGLGHGWPQSLGFLMGQSSNRFGMHPQTDRRIGLFPYFKVLLGEHQEICAGVNASQRGPRVLELLALSHLRQFNLRTEPQLGAQPSHEPGKDEEQSPDDARPVVELGS